MGIEALPSSTVRTLGAGQVLTDPASAIKELIDNALDARSTSIAVEIHNNTLDVIQLRDNGHGIPPEDRQLVARPRCTSKIDGEDDLKSIGGISLGFRGEALASMAEMSGSLTISTRVEGEQVATALKINQQGEVTGQDRASLPVGTTVKITDFIKAHPVRRQVALKNAEKTLSKIKQTLKSYAFARPHVRFSLRVLKAKNEKSNWMYAPKQGGNAEDTAFKIVGAACASQCTWSVVEEHGFSLQAFLPKPDADTYKVNNIGSFLSIDARPVSTARGIPKQVVKIFREAFKKANARAEGIKEPFLFLEIRCPSASYDANVEPAKDDVLFEDTDLLVGLVRQLFDVAYPSQEVQSAPMEPVGKPSSRAVSPRLQPDEDDFTTSLEPARPGAKAPQAHLDWTPLPSDISLPAQGLDFGLDTESRPNHEVQRSFRGNMYGCGEEDVELFEARPPTCRTEADFEDLRQANKDINVSNPWVFAKLNAPLRGRAISPYGDTNITANATPSVHQQLGCDQDGSVQGQSLGLPTPRPSSPVHALQNLYSSDYDPSSLPHENSRSIGLQSLPKPGMMIYPPSSFSEDDRADSMHSSEQRQRPEPAYNYELASQDGEPARGTQLGAIPQAGANRRPSPRKPRQQGLTNTPFKSPLVHQAPQEKVWFDHLENIDRPRKRPYQPRPNDGLVVQGELGDLVDDPRPLTPPRRNRDMRDFFTPQYTQGDSAAGVVESRHYPQQDPIRQTNNTISVGQDNDENKMPADESLSRRGFMSASNFAALEAQLGPLKPDAVGPSKRRKTSEGRILRGISGNAVTRHDDTTGAQQVPDEPAISRRKSTLDGSVSKSRRSKSARLPLERVPKGQGTHGLVLNLRQDMFDSAGRIDEKRSLLGMNEPSIDAYDVFGERFDDEALNEVTTRLHELLVMHVPDSEMTQDLGTVVRGAFETYRQQMTEME